MKQNNPPKAKEVFYSMLMGRSGSDEDLTTTVLTSTNKEECAARSSSLTGGSVFPG